MREVGVVRVASITSLSSIAEYVRGLSDNRLKEIDERLQAVRLDPEMDDLKRAVHWETLKRAKSPTSI